MDNTTIVETKNKRAPVADGEIIYKNGKVEKLEYGTEEIAEDAYFGNDDIVSAVLPDSVTKICDSAFFNCRSLVSVTVPDSVEEIGAAAFSRCFSLTSIKLPSGMKKISSFCLSCTLITEIAIPDGVEEIESYSFFHCMDLKKIYLPKSIKNIDETAFEDCTLSDVYYSGSKADWAQRHYIKLNDMFAGVKIHYSGTSEAETDVQTPQEKTEATPPQNGLFQSIKKFFEKK